MNHAAAADRAPPQCRTEARRGAPALATLIKRACAAPQGAADLAAAGAVADGGDGSGGAADAAAPAARAAAKARLTAWLALALALCAALLVATCCGGIARHGVSDGDNGKATESFQMDRLQAALGLVGADLQRELEGMHHALLADLNLQQGVEARAVRDTLLQEVQESVRAVLAEALEQRLHAPASGPLPNRKGVDMPYAPEASRARDEATADGDDGCGDATPAHGAAAPAVQAPHAAAPAARAAASTRPTAWQDLALLGLCAALLMATCCVVLRHSERTFQAALEVERGARMLLQQEKASLTSRVDAAEAELRTAAAVARLHEAAAARWGQREAELEARVRQLEAEAARAAPSGPVTREETEAGKKHGSLLDAATAGSVAAIRYHVKRGANVNAADDPNGWTPLHRAASNSHAEAVRALLAAGASKTATDNAGRTPRDVALAYGRAKFGKAAVAALLS